LGFLGFDLRGRSPRESGRGGARRGDPAQQQQFAGPDAARLGPQEIRTIFAIDGTPFWSTRNSM
jgi:hypothetical protein